jgi:hypothetical protein
MMVNEEKRAKFMEYAGKRVNNVMHDMQILEPMARSAAYDFTKQDVEEMFAAMQETLNAVKAEYEKKFEEKARSEKKVFSFGQTTAPVATAAPVEATMAASSISAVEAIATEEVAETLESAETSVTPDTTTF